MTSLSKGVQTYILHMILPDAGTLRVHPQAEDILKGSTMRRTRLSRLGAVGFLR